MKKLITLSIFSIALIISSCGSSEEKKTEAPTWCDCVNAKGAPPAGCKEVTADVENMTPEEFAAKKDECK